MYSASGIIGTRIRFLRLLPQQRRNRTSEAEAENRSGDLRAAQTHHDSERNRRQAPLIINPEGKKRLLPVVAYAEGSKEKLRAWQLEDDLCQIHLPLRHLVLQRRGQLIDIPRSNVYRHMIGQQRSSIAAHGVAPHLNQQ